VPHTRAPPAPASSASCASGMKAVKGQQTFKATGVEAFKATCVLLSLVVLGCLRSSCMPVRVAVALVVLPLPLCLRLFASLSAASACLSPCLSPLLLSPLMWP
jgi:hypothetical protein